MEKNDDDCIKRDIRDIYCGKDIRKVRYSYVRTGRAFRELSTKPFLVPNVNCTHVALTFR